MPAPSNREVSTSLIHTAMAVEFQLVEQRVLEAPDPAEFGMRILLHLGDPDDEFEIGDLVSLLSFVRGELHVRADYVRGRRMKTDLTVRQDGTLILETIGRGKAPLRWIDRILGKTPLAAVPGGASAGSEPDEGDAGP